MTDNDSMEFAANLRKVAGDKLPAILVPGPTVEGLRPYVKDLAPFVFWCGISKWWYLEQELLAPHGEQVTFVWCGCQLTIASELEQIDDLLHRDAPTMFVTKNFGLTGMSAKNELTGHPRVWVSDVEESLHHNALGGALFTFLSMGFPAVLTIGADGQSVAGRRHFGEDEYAKRWDWYDKQASMERVTKEMLALEQTMQKFPDFAIVNVSDAPVWQQIPSIQFSEMPKVIEQMYIAKEGLGEHV